MSDRVDTGMMHGSWDEKGAQRWCKDCEVWVRAVDWVDHRDHGGYRLEVDRNV